jgi:flagellar biosynthesis/type III secretory pathway protein FliH
MPGIEIPEIADLQEVKSMLAERVMEWTHQWKQEGLEEGLQKGRQEGQEDALVKAREVLLRDLMKRFGPLPEETRRRVGAIASIEDLMELSIRAGAASSLAGLK